MGFQGAVRNSGVIAVCILLTSTAWAQTTVIHPEVLRSRAGMGSLPSGAALASLKVAILDVGFSGYSASSGRLPESAQLNEGLVNPLLATNHGLVMAEIIWGMLGRRAEGPRFYLVNTNGLSNFRAAIEFVIAHEIDVVVYAQNWVYGGNLDGTGFVDALVTRALDAGVTWINAAGNDHDLVFAGAVRSRTDGTVILPGAGDTLSIRTDLDDTEVTVALLWTDVQDDDRVTATTDLDVIFETTTGMELASGRHRQGGAVGEASTSRFARESAMATVNRGEYRVRISDISHNFRSTDELRVVLSSNKPGSVHLTEATGRREILPPADHPGVITVGDGSSHSSVGPTGDGRTKPDVTIADSSVSFTDGMTSAGSSNATALFAARVVAEFAARETPRGAARRTLVTDLARSTSAPAAFVCLREIPFWHLNSDGAAGLPQGTSAFGTGALGTRAGMDPEGHHYAVLAPGRTRAAVRGTALQSPFFRVITADEEPLLCAGAAP